MVYLKISLSDFLTLFAARTRTWFWERRPGYMLGAAALVATGSSTILSLFWNDILPSNDDNTMVGLRHSKYAVVAVWVYCLLWFFAQDAAKVASYWLLDYLNREDDERLDAVAKKGELAAMYAADNQRARRTGQSHARTVNFSDREGPAPAELVAELKSLKAEVAQLRDAVRSAGIGGAGAARAH